MKIKYSQFKDSTLIVIVLYKDAAVFKYVIQKLFAIINDRPNTWVVLICNNPAPDVMKVVHGLKHSQLIIFECPFNFGKALAANFFFREYITQHNLPQTIVSLDPDTIFSKESFEQMVEGSIQCPQIGMLGMRYEKNECNPERNLILPARACKGKNGVMYAVKQPLFCTVAGPVFAVQAKKIFEDCDNKLFPKKYIKVYGGDDSALHAALKWSYINGYLEGTLATHLHSNGKLAKAYRGIISA